MVGDMHMRSDFPRVGPMLPMKTVSLRPGRPRRPGVAGTEVRPAGANPSAFLSQHQVAEAGARTQPILKGITLDTMPPILGFNRVRPREGRPVAARWYTAREGRR